MTVRTFGVGAVLVAGIVLFYLDRRATRSQLAALWTSQSARAERVEQRPQVVWMSPPAGHPEAQAALAPVAPAQPTLVDGNTAGKPQSAPRSMIEQFAAAHDALEAAFGAESRDGAWAMNAQRTAETALSAALPPRSAIRSVDCRATLCRVESTHASYAQAKTFVNQLTTRDSRPWNGGFYTGPVAQDASGAVTFVTYLGREGVAMPGIPDRPEGEPPP